MATGPTGNQRRYVRQSVVLGARLRLASGKLLPCEIRDFCPGGLFLKLLSGESAFAYPDTRRGCAVTVLFQASRKASPFELDGHIAHVSERGVGIAFAEKPSEVVLSALRERAQASPDGNPGGAPFGRAVDLEALGEACRQVLEVLVDPLLTDFFREADVALLDTAGMARTNGEQTVYYEARSLLRSHRAAIETAFSRQALKKVEGFVAVPLEPVDSRAAGAGLSLVEPEEFEDWLNLTEEIAKAENLHRDVLQCLERRFSLLAQRAVNRNNNPYGPGVIEHALRAALRELPLQNAARRLIYGVFSRVLAPYLDSLYRRLDEITAALVREDEVARPLKSATPVTAEKTAVADTAPCAMEAPKPTPYAAVRTLLSLCSPQPSTGNGKLDAAAIISALQRLQNRKAQQGLDYLQTPALEAALVQDLAGPEARLDALAGEHGQTIAALGALLDQALSRDEVPAGVKPYLQALQIPLLEAALADPGLLQSESHPARDVVNMLDQLALATNARGEIDNAGLRQAVDAIVDDIVVRGADNPRVFEEAKIQLERLTAPLLKARAARVARLQEACEADRRVMLARRAVAGAIDARLAGKRVPALLPQLLDAGWRQWLVLTALREGVDTPSWEARLGVLDRLSSWLAPEGAARPVAEAEARRLIEQVDEELRTVCSEPSLLNRIILELTALLIGRSDTGERKVPEWVTMPPAMPEPEEDGAQAKAISFRLGDWLEFSQGSGDRKSLCLSWMGEHPARYVFADDKGHKELELGAAQFVRALQEGRARLTEQRELPLLERVTGRLLQGMQDKLKFQATHDAVTGLLNRKEFVRQLRRRFAAAGPPIYLLSLLDLAQLRAINHLCGLEAGDRLLKETSAVLRERIPGDLLLARLGDSSFGVLLEADSPDQVRGKAEELLQVVADRHFSWGEHRFTLAANLGLACAVGNGGDPEVLLNNADAACLAAKQKGHNRLQIYRAGDVSLEAQKHMLDWAGRIDSLMNQDRLFVRCQRIAPIFPERDAHSHYEILLGIHGRPGDDISPFEFVVAAERWNRASEIDRWQIQSVFHWVREHYARFRDIGGFSINLSGQSLNSEDFLAFLHAQLAQDGLPADKITFEITETSAIGEFGHAGQFIRQIKRHGCRFSLDDFGSGFSSYSYLKNLQADYLKIDGSYVKDLVSNSVDFALVKSMNDIGHSLGMKTIAEYVESEAILEKLREIGVDYAQGYAVGRPSPITDLDEGAAEG